MCIGKNGGLYLPHGKEMPLQGARREDEHASRSYDTKPNENEAATFRCGCFQCFKLGNAHRIAEKQQDSTGESDARTNDRKHSSADPAPGKVIWTQSTQKQPGHWANPGVITSMLQPSTLSTATRPTSAATKTGPGGSAHGCGGVRSATAGETSKAWEVLPWCPETQRVRELVLDLKPEAGKVRLGWKSKQSFLVGVHYGSGRRIRVSLPLPGVGRCLTFAMRRWFLLGGMPVLRAGKRRRLQAAKARLKAATERERQEAQQCMWSYTAGLACSGGPLPRVAPEQRLEVTIGPSCRSRLPKRQRDWLAGLRPDRAGRWAVACIVAVRSREPHGRGFDVLVDWEGPFAASWVRKSDLCGPARTEARQIAREFYSLHPEEDSWFSNLEEDEVPAHAEGIQVTGKRPRLAEAAVRMAESQAGSHLETPGREVARAPGGKRARSMLLGKAAAPTSEATRADVSN